MEGIDKNTLLLLHGESASAVLPVSYASDNPLPHLITDRVLADVQALNDKGTYNSSDLNRVGHAINYIAGRLRDAGYIVNVSPKTNWTNGDIPDTPSMDHYVADLREIRGALTLAVNTPNVPDSMANLSYEQANDIEKMLLAVDETIELIRSIMLRVDQNFLYSGYAMYLSYREPPMLLITSDSMRVRTSSGTVVHLFV